MPMPWFRFYSSVLDDPKVQRLTGDLFKVWVNLLCLANDADERGTLPERDDIAFRLRLDDQKAEDALNGLRRAGLLDQDDSGRLQIHGWHNRQFRSDVDPTATDRKRRQRDRDRDNPNVTRDVTRDISARHASVTRTDTDTDTDTEADTEQKQRETPTPPTPPKPAPPRGGGRVRAAPKPSTLNADQRERFDRWYPTYPNKQHRPEAEKAFARLDPDDATTAAMVTDTAVRQGGRKWAEGYIEHPATYLNNRVWEDDIEPVRAAPIPLHGSTELIGKDRERAEVLRRVLARRGIHGPGSTDADPATHGGGVSRLADRTRA